MDKTAHRTHEVSGDLFVSKQTEAIAREFKRSKPYPRPSRMGFPRENIRQRRPRPVGF